MKMFSKLKELLLSYPTSADLKWGINGLSLEAREQSLKQNILFRTEAGITDRKYGSSEVVVSLTTFGRRINYVALAIESIMEQTALPNRIVLWLDHRFDAPGMLPFALRKLRDRGLEIRFCDDIGPHTKLIPSLKAFPEATVITVDDDCYYEYDVLSRLLCVHEVYPGDIVALRARRIQMDRDGVSGRFVDWPFVGHTDNAGMAYLPEGVGGVLYPPHSLHEEVFNEEGFRKFSASTDDFWFKAMSLMQGTPVRMAYAENAYKSIYTYNPTHQFESLEKNNHSRGEYERQIKALFDNYDLYRFLEKDS